MFIKVMLCVLLLSAVVFGEDKVKKVGQSRPVKSTKRRTRAAPTEPSRLEKKKCRIGQACHPTYLPENHDARIASHQQCIEDKLKKYQACVKLPKIPGQTGDMHDCDSIAHPTSAHKDDSYDVVLDITSLQGLGHKDGWSLEFKTTQSLKEILNKKSKLKVAMLGMFNRGKTYVMNHLTQRKFAAGKLKHTAGLSMMLADNGMPWLMMDSAGEQQPVPRSLYRDRQFSEMFLKDLVTQNSHVMIVVVNSLTFADQKCLDDLEETLTNQPELFKRRPLVIVVHNYLNMESVKDVKAKINKDLIESFEAEEREVRLNHEETGEADKFWVHKLVKYNEATDGDLLPVDILPENSLDVRHVVIAREGTAAGDHFNNRTFTLLRMWLQTKYAGIKFRKNELSILGKMMKSTEQILTKYFKLPSKIQDDDGKKIRTPPIQLRLTCDPEIDNPRITLNLREKYFKRGKNKLIYRKGAKFQGFQVTFSDANSLEILYEIERFSDESDKPRTVLRIEFPNVIACNGDGQTPLESKCSGVNCRVVFPEHKDKGSRPPVQIYVRNGPYGPYESPTVILRGNKRNIYRLHHKDSTDSQMVYQSTRYGTFKKVIVVETPGDQIHNFDDFSVKFSCSGVLEIVFSHAEEAEDPDEFPDDEHDH